jgi:hypothetical protein
MKWRLIGYVTMMAAAVWFIVSGLTAYFAYEGVYSGLYKGAEVHALMRKCNSNTFQAIAAVVLFFAGAFVKGIKPKELKSLESQKA